jgi:hypothetical protein
MEILRGNHICNMMIQHHLQLHNVNDNDNNSDTNNSDTNTWEMLFTPSTSEFFKYYPRYIQVSLVL